MPEDVYTSPYDDQTDGITDDTIVYRKVAPTFIDWNILDELGNPRIKSGAFQDYGKKKAAQLGYPAPAMSVCLANIMVERGVEPPELINREGPKYGVARFTAGDVRRFEQGVMHRPTDDEPWHGIVFSKIGNQRKDSMQDAVQDCAVWVVPPQER